METPKIITQPTVETKEIARKWQQEQEEQRFIEMCAYNDAQMERRPLPIIKKAVELAKGRDKAIDLGAGALRESKYMAENGFTEVISVDEVAEDRWAVDVDLNIVNRVQTKIEEYSFSEGDCDLVNAIFSLPFVKKNQLVRIMNDIEKSLKSGGIFCGSFFGPEDLIIKNQRALGIEKEELKKFLGDLKIINEIHEEKGAGIGQYGKKDLHIFHVIAQKK